MAILTVKYSSSNIVHSYNTLSPDKMTTILKTAFLPHFYSSITEVWS